MSAGITTDNGDLTLIANDTAAHGVVNAYRDPGAAAITFLLGGINAGTGNVNILLDTGAGKTNTTSGSITLGPVAGKDITVTNAGLTAGSSVVLGNVSATGNINVSSTNDVTFGLLSAVDYQSNGGGKTLSVTANGNITSSASINDSVTGGGDSLNVIFNSDRDASGSGAIALSGATIATNGGALTLGGGSGNPVLTGFAASTTLLGSGVDVSTSTLNSGGGAITMRGAYNGVGTPSGVSISGSALDSGAGNLTVTGTGAGAGTNIEGVLVSASNLSATTGHIALSGVSTASGLAADTGLYLTGGLGSTISTTTGNITLTGTGSATGGITGGNRGVAIDSLYTVSTAGGNISVTGQGGGTSGSNGENDGLLLALSSLKTTGAGSITLNVTGGGAGLGTGSSGLDLGLGSVIQTVAGAINATANGGRGLVTGNEAVALAGTISSQSGSINVTATADQFAGNLSEGVKSVGGVIRSTGSAPITVTAIAGPAGGVGLNSAGGLVIGGASATGDITLSTDRISLNSLGDNVQSTGALIIQPVTPGTTIGIGGLAPTGTLNLNALELAHLGSNFRLVTFGNAASGAIDLETASFTSGLRLRNALDTVIGGALNTVGNLVWIDSGGGNITQSAPIQAAQLLLTGAGNFNLTQTLNQIGTLAANVTGDLNVTNNGSLVVGSITNGTTVSGITATGLVNLVANGAAADITLLGNITAAGTGTTVQLVAGHNFLNTGNVTINPGLGRFLIWSTSPGSDVRGGLSYGFKQYHAVLGSTAAAEANTNGLLYSLAPKITASLTGSVNKIYDGTTSATLGAANYAFGGLVDGDVAAPAAVSALTTFDAKDVGGLKSITAVGVNLPTTSNGPARVYGYDLLATTLTAAIGNITPATLSASVTGHATKIYDGNTDAAITVGVNAGLTGLIGSDLVTVGLPLSGTYDTKNVGTNKNVTLLGLTLNGAAAGNYVLASANVSAAIGDITPLALTASLTGSVTRTYDRTTVATLTAGNYVLSGLVGTDAVTLTAPFSGTYDSKNVGTGKLVSVGGLALLGADAGNYVLSSAGVSANIGTITAATLSAGLTGATAKVYDGNTTAILAGGNFLLAGVLGSDSVTLDSPLSGTYDSKNAGAGKLVTAAGLILNGADAGNYVLASTSASSAIGQIAQATIAASISGNVSKVYDTTTAASLAGATVVFTGLVGADDLTVNAPSTGAFDTKNAGTGKLVTFSGVTLGGAEASNYVLASTNLTASGVITPATLSAGLTGTVSKVYDGDTSATLGSGNYTLAGILGADAVSLNNPLAGSYDTKNVGSGKLVTASSLLLSGVDSANYVLASTSASAAIGVITPASLTVSLTVGVGSHVTKTYDTNTTATLGASNYALTGLIGTDAVLVSGPSTGLYDNKNVGTNKLITVAGVTLLGGDAGNYTIASSTISANIGAITPATLTAGLTGTVSKVYDGTTNATLSSGNYSLSGVLGADNVALNNPAAGLYDTKNAGVGKLVTASGLLLGGADASNYVLASTSAAGAIGTITQAGLSVTVTGGMSGLIQKIYDANTVANLSGTTYTLTGLAGADAVTLNGPATGTFDDKNVGSAKLVTIAGLTLSGADAGNYAISSTVTSAVGVITRAGLTVNLTGTAAKGYDTTAAATLSSGNFSLQGVLGTDALTLTTPTTGLYDSKNVGTGKLVTASGFALSGADAGNYTITSATISANIGAITPATLGAGLTGTVSKVYDGDTTAMLGSGNYTLTGLLGLDNVSLNNPLAGSYDTKNVGSGKLVTANGLLLSGADSANYVLASTSASAAIGVITPASLTVSLTVGVGSQVTKTYDTNTTATLGASNYALTGLIGTDAVLVSGPSTGLYDNKNVGTNKLITAAGVTLLGGDAGNYTIASSTISANIGAITPATLTAGLTGTVSKVYDGTTNATLNGGNYSLSGVLGADAVSLNNPTTGLYDTKNVGIFKLVNVTGLSLGGAEAGNYVLASSSAAANIGVITPAAVNLALSASLTGTVSKTYDTTAVATLGAGNYLLSGFLAGDLVSLNNPLHGLFDDKNVGTNKLVTVTGLALLGADAGNYSLLSTTISGAVGIITPAPLAAALGGLVTKTYDTTRNTALGSGNLSLTGVFSGENVSLTAASALYDTKDVGLGKNVTVTGLSLAGLDAANYVLTSATVSAAIGTITPASVVAGLTGSITKVYDGNAGATVATGNYTLSGVLGGEAVTLNVPAAGFYDTKNVGSNKLVSVSGLALTGTGAGNYVLVSSTASATIGAITPATLTVGLTGGAAGSISKVYDATTTANVGSGSFTLIGLAGSDTVLVTSSGLGSYDTKDVGTNKLVTLSGLSLTGAEAGNYVLASSSISGNVGTITAATLGVSLTGSLVKIYDTTTAAALTGANFTMAGVLGSDAVSLNHPLFGSFDTKNAGFAKIVTAAGLSLGGTDAGNYVLASATVAGAIGQITPAAVLASLTGQIGKVYDTITAASIAASHYLLTGVLGGDALALNNPASGTFETKNAGTGKTVTINGLALTGAEAGNYTLASTTISAAAGFITPATLTATLTGTVAKVYDATRNAALAAGNYELNGLLGADMLTIDGAATFDTKNAGSGKLVTVNGLTLGGADAGNYALAATTAGGAIGVITPATLTLSGVSKSYDGHAAGPGTGGYTLAGVFSGDSVLVSAATGAYADKNVLANHGTGSFTLTSLTLGGGDEGNYIFDGAQIGTPRSIGTITPTTLRIVAHDQWKWYGQNDQVNNGRYTVTGLQNGETAGMITLSSVGAAADALPSEEGYTIQPKWIGGGTLDISNYSLHYVSGRLHVMRAVAKIETPAESPRHPGGKETAPTVVISRETTRFFEQSFSPAYLAEAGFVNRYPSSWRTWIPNESEVFNQARQFELRVDKAAFAHALHPCGFRAGALGMAESTTFTTFRLSL